LTLAEFAVTNIAADELTRYRGDGHGSEKEVEWAKVRQSRRETRRKRDATEKEGHAQERTKRS
jgi:hypothetical protein